MTLVKYLFCVAALCSCLSCDDRRDIRDYYFPVRELINMDGKVYAYESTGTLPSPDTTYWYYLGVDLDTSLYLTATRYGPDKSPVQLSREQLTNEGVRLQEMTLFEADSAGVVIPTQAEILYNQTFPFYLDEATVAGYRLRLNNSVGRTTYVTLNRYFRYDTTLTVLGEAHDAIVVELQGEVSQRDAVEGDISPTFSGYEIYARGLGLVEYYRDLGAAGTTGGRLVRRLPMTEFAER